VASRDDDKGAPTNDKDEEEQNEHSNRSWFRQSEITYVYRSFLHRSPPLGVLTG
jgi:hypothetical protein